MGADAQAVINQQIGDAYDVYIGIMWSRFGSPTPRAGSGTEEEFDRALKRATQSGGRVKIMFYFKNDPLPLTEIDHEQLKRISEFKAKLREQGVLYSDYQGDFADHVRIHLSREIIDFVNSSRDAVSATPGVAARSGTPDTPAREDEPGVFDGIAAFYRHLGVAAEGQSRITDAINVLGDAFVRRTTQITSSDAGEITLDFLQEVADLSAGDLDKFATAIEAELPVVDEEFRAAIQTYSVILPHLSQMGVGGEQQISRMREFLPGFLSQIESTADSARGFRETISSTPPLTSAHSHARKRAVNAQDRILEQLAQQAALVRQLIDSLPPSTETSIE